MPCAEILSFFKTNTNTKKEKQSLAQLSRNQELLNGCV